MGRDELEPALRGIGHAGCLVDHDGALQPARWIRALATDAERAGVRIYENTRGTPGHPVKAVHTVIAGDAASATVVSAVKARRLHMIATAPLAERVVDTLVYARYGYEYFQQPPDGRIALGGFSDLDGEASYTDVEDGNPAVWEEVSAGHKQVMAWAYERPDGGRGFGFTGLHKHSNLGNDDFRRLLLNALAWVAKLDVPENGVPSKPLSRDDLERLIDEGKLAVKRRGI